MHKHIQESFLLRRRTEGNLAWCFHSFLQVFERGFHKLLSIETEVISACKQRHLDGRLANSRVQIKPRINQVVKTLVANSCMLHAKRTYRLNHMIHAKPIIVVSILYCKRAKHRPDFRFSRQNVAKKSTQGGIRIQPRDLQFEMGNGSYEA